MFVSGGVQAVAQQFATVRITVEDAAGRLIPEAKVSVQNKDTGVLRYVSSDKTGDAEVPGLVAGIYIVRVSAAGFAIAETPLTLALGESASLHTRLQVAGTSQEVDVRDTPVGVETDRTAPSQVISPSEIQNLPILERDFIDFALLTPTAAIGRNFTTGAQSAFQEPVLQISFGGLRETHSVFYGLDGIDYTTTVSGIQRVSPSIEWVQEFRVVNGPGATEGLNMGGSVATITRSGTDTFHGSVYDYFRNNALNANNLLSAPGFNALRFNQFGTTAGDPIRKEKTFFFAGFEGQRRAQSPLYSSFILRCIDTQGCLGPGTPSINQVKTRLGLAPENLRANLLTADYNNAFGKLTDVLSERSTLNVGYLYTAVHNGGTPAASPGQGLPSSYRDNRIHDQTVYGDFFHLMGARWNSESALTFGRRIFHTNPVGAGFEPSLNVADTLYSGGFLGGVSYYSEHHFQAKEALTRSGDRNSVTFGADVEPIWFAAQTPYFTPGVGIFSPQSFFGTGPFAAFGPGTAVQFLFQQPRTEFGRQVPQRALPFQNGFYTGPDAAARQSADAVAFWHRLVSLYVQDQWKPGSGLAVSLGLRYDIDVFPSAADLGILGNMNPTNYGNVQPRVGVAYTFRNDRSVIRSSFGLYTGSFEYSSTVNGWHGASAFTAMNQPYLPEFSDPANQLVGFGEAGMVGTVGPGTSAAAFSNFTRNGIYPSPAVLKQFPLGFVRRKFPNAYSEQATLEFENDLGRRWFLTAGYHYVHAMHLLSSNTINGAPAGTLIDGRQRFTPADSNFGFALYATPSGWSIYNAGTLTLRRGMAQHFSLLANYTYAKSIDVATENQLQDEPQNYLRPDLDRAVSDNDVRHRLTLTALAEAPETWSPALRHLQFSILNTLQTPQFYNILAGSDVNGDGFPFNDRVGSIGRNSYRGAAYYDTDVRLQRLVALTERAKLNASFEALNVFNRVNVQDVDQVYGAAQFAGPVPRGYGDGVTSAANPTFGTPTFTGPARQLQLSLKLTY